MFGPATRNAACKVPQLASSLLKFFSSCSQFLASSLRISRQGPRVHAELVGQAAAAASGRFQQAVSGPPAAAVVYAAPPGAALAQAGSGAHCTVLGLF